MRRSGRRCRRRHAMQMVDLPQQPVPENDEQCYQLTTWWSWNLELPQPPDSCCTPPALTSSCSQSASHNTTVVTTFSSVMLVSRLSEGSSVKHFWNCKSCTLTINKKLSCREVVRCFVFVSSQLQYTAQFFITTLLLLHDRPQNRI